MAPAAWRPHWLYGGSAIPGHCRLAGPPPGGRTSGRPCSCAEKRAACVRTNRESTAEREQSPAGTVSFDRWIARGCPCQSSGVDSERRQDAGSELASSDRRAGCPKGASGEMAWATPSHATGSPRGAVVVHGPDVLPQPLQLSRRRRPAGSSARACGDQGRRRPSVRGSPSRLTAGDGRRPSCGCTAATAPVRR